MGRLTIFEIARLAGVSTGTVSRVLNDRADVSAETRSRVMQIVREVGYVPDAGARRLARGSLELVGVLPFNENAWRSPYYSVLLDAFQEQLIHTGFAARVLDSHSPESVLQQCSGFIVPGLYLDDPRLPQLAHRGKPYVVIGQAVGASWVDVDNRGGILRAMDHLAHLGHRRIAFMTGSPVGQTTQARLDAYREALELRGWPLETPLVWDGQFTDLGGYRATRKALEAGLEFTAVLCGSDDMALGALAALEDAEVQVPLEVSVVGFDDLHAAIHARPALTTVRQPVREVGHQAAALLIDLIAGNPVQSCMMPTELVVRASSGPSLHRDSPARASLASG